MGFSGGEAKDAGVGPGVEDAFEIYVLQKTWIFKEYLTCNKQQDSQPKPNLQAGAV